MATYRAPKQWSLSKTEDLNSFESWRNNLIYVLNQDQNFSPFLLSTATWEKKSRTRNTRGLRPDVDLNVQGSKNAASKVIDLEMMLGMISNYAPIISRHQIINNSTSLEWVWQALRAHYGIQTSGAQFLDLADFVLAHEERPEDLFQRLMTFVEDSLLTSTSNIRHHGVTVSEDEEMTPALENMIVLTWLRLIHKDLPKLVKQKYGTVLRACTLASIKPEISIALDSLLDEIGSTHESKLMRVGPASGNSFSKNYSSASRRVDKPYTGNRSSSYKPSPKSCPICKAAQRNDQHFLSTCRHLPPSDRKFLTKARLVQAIDDMCLSDNEENSQYYDDSDRPNSLVSRVSSSTVSSRRVQTCRSPCFSAFAKDVSVKVVVDSGAEVSMVHESLAASLKCKISQSSQRAIQADGCTPIQVVGEVDTVIYRNNLPLRLQALVCSNIDDQVIAGIPFLKQNGIKLNFVNDTIVFCDDSSAKWSSSDSRSGSVYHMMRVIAKTTVWPDEVLELDVPSILPPDSVLAIEPRVDTKFPNWLSPQETVSVGQKIRLVNSSDLPVNLAAKSHVCHVVKTCSPPEVDEQSPVFKASKPISPYTSAIVYSDVVNNESILSKFRSIHGKFDHVFNPTYPGYNSFFGKISGSVNIESILPPQRKGRIPQYDKSKLQELQLKCDELEKLGVLRKPDAIGVRVEYLNPSFLIKKASGGHRLVTAFSEVAKYARPQPSLMPDIDTTLRLIANWKFLVKTDLTSAFYQIPLDKSSLKFCGIVTPYKGIRVYTRCAMGLPGSETALEELMSRVLGDLLQSGCVAKVADDLYIGGKTLDDLANNWESVLSALSKADLRLAAHKTEIAPQQTTILGWLWSNGSLSALPHRISSLSTCSKPVTVKNMRSFLGAYKFLSRVIPNVASLLAPLEVAISGYKSSDPIKWDSVLEKAFISAQNHLMKNETIHTPVPGDKLWIMTDGAVKSPGVGATLYTQGLNEKPRLAGFFSMKLKKPQVRWSPCETEALAIAAAIKHFSPYIIQASSPATILSDSKPCIQAAQKLARGEFSASARVATFISIASRYHVSFMHLKGSQNISADFQSRNPPDCDSPSCQVCQFVENLANCVVRQITVGEILAGKGNSPFASRNAWMNIQSDCPDITNAKGLLKAGSRLSKTTTKLTDVKRYLNVASIARDDLLVVRRSEPFTATRECIVVPRSVSHGLVTALHIRLDHPSVHQLKQVISRSFYMIGLDRIVESVGSECSTCASLKTFPKHLVTQETGEPPAAIGISFAADVLKREKQCILIVRENITCYTAALIVENEKTDTLRDALIQLIVPISPSTVGLKSVVRTDPAPAFQALADDAILSKHNICIELGRRKNIDKNPRAERAVQEVVEELKRVGSNSGVSPVRLSLVIAGLNNKVRSTGLSATELWTHRDQHTGEQLPFDHVTLISKRQADREQSHSASAASKARAPSRIPLSIVVGDIVYLISDRSKVCSRSKYLVTSIEGEWCNIQKFTSFQLRGFAYRVRLTDVFKAAPTKASPSRQHVSDPESDVDEVFPIEPPPVDASPHQSPLANDVPDVPEDHNDDPNESLVEEPEERVATPPSPPVVVPRRGSRHKTSVFDRKLKDFTA